MFIIRRHRGPDWELRQQLQEAKRDMEAARAAFDMALDQDLVSAAIFELNAAKLRYSSLLKKLRGMESAAQEA